MIDVNPSRTTRALLALAAAHVPGAGLDPPHARLAESGPGSPSARRRSTRRPGPTATLVATGCAGIIGGKPQMSGGPAGQPKIDLAFAVETSSSGSVAMSFTRLPTLLVGELPSPTSRRLFPPASATSAIPPPASATSNGFESTVSGCGLTFSSYSKRFATSVALPPEMRQMPWPVSSSGSSPAPVVAQRPPPDRTATSLMPGQRATSAPGRRSRLLRPASATSKRAARAVVDPKIGDA